MSIKGGYKTMSATNQITNILQAMGANPETITNAAGETLIKVNAPEIKPTRYYIVRSWANASMIAETLAARGIPCATYVLNGTSVQIEINAENLPRALQTCDGWKILY